MSSAIYYIVFILVSFTSTSAQWELDRNSAASGIMRREKQEVEITAHALAHTTKDFVSDDSNPGEHVHQDGKKQFIRKAQSHSEAGAKAASEQESEETGISQAHHKSQHHHKSAHAHGGQKHGHNHRHRKHKKVQDKKEPVAPHAAKKTVQTTHAENKDSTHGQHEKHAGKEPTAAHAESKVQGEKLGGKEPAAAHVGSMVQDEKLQKGDKHGHDEKQAADKASRQDNNKPAIKELTEESAHPSEKDAKHAHDVKDVEPGSSHGHDKKVVKKTAEHGDIKLAANELPKSSEHPLAKDAKKPSAQEQNKKSAVHGQNTAGIEKMEKTSEPSVDTHGRQPQAEKQFEKTNQPDHRTPADTGKSSLTAADDVSTETGNATQQDAAALEEIAKEVESLQLTESEIDPDENFHAHKHEAFQVKVTGPSGHEMCLSEVHQGYQVRAVKCSPAQGQHWYWHDKQLKTLKSKERCLGYMSQTGHHRLAMYPCDEIEDPKSTSLAWKVEDTGRLRSLNSDRCMAFEPESDSHLNAITLPCDEPEDAEETHEEAVAPVK